MSFAKVKRELANQAEHQDLLPCMSCGEPTKRETLTDFGARCFPCFKAYCREPQVKPPRSAMAERIRAEIAAAGKWVPR